MIKHRHPVAGQLCKYFWQASEKHVKHYSLLQNIPIQFLSQLQIRFPAHHTVQSTASSFYPSPFNVKVFNFSVSSCRIVATFIWSNELIKCFFWGKKITYQMTLLHLLPSGTLRLKINMLAHFDRKSKQKLVNNLTMGFCQLFWSGNGCVLLL